MLALHKPQRATYGQAVEAQVEFGEIVCREKPPFAKCIGTGTLLCCV